MLPESDSSSETTPYMERYSPSDGGESDDSSDTVERPAKPAHTKGLPAQYKDKAHEWGADYTRLSNRNNLTILIETGIT